MAKNFAAERAATKGMLKQATNMRMKSKMTCISLNESRLYVKNAKILETKASIYTSNDRWIRYVEGAEEYINRYKVYAKDEVLDLDTKTKKENPQDVRDRVSIIEEFLEFIREFIGVDIQRNDKIQSRCVLCGELYTDKNVSEDNNKYVCKCGHSYYLTSKEVSYHDPYQLNGAPAHEDSNLIDNISRFCGKKVNVDIPDMLYRQFDAHLKIANMPIGADYRALPIEPTRHLEVINNKNGTSVKMVINMLKDTNNSFCYDDVNYIGQQYFGWILPDLSEHINIIVSVNDLTKKIYERMPSRKISSLNTTMILYFTLEFLKIPTCAEDFKLMDTKDSFDDYRETWRRITSTEEMIEMRNENLKSRCIEINKTEIVIV
jgi:hypothetical protein